MPVQNRYRSFVNAVLGLGFLFIFSVSSTSNAFALVDQNKIIDEGEVTYNGIEPAAVDQYLASQGSQLSSYSIPSTFDVYYPIGKGQWNKVSVPQQWQNASGLETYYGQTLAELLVDWSATSRLRVPGSESPGKINPLIPLATLDKESGSILGSYRGQILNRPITLSWLTGYGFDDTMANCINLGACDVTHNLNHAVAYGGPGQQIVESVAGLKRWNASPISMSSTCGTNWQNMSIEGQCLSIVNPISYALYRYTPNFSGNNLFVNQYSAIKQGFGSFGQYVYANAGSWSLPDPTLYAGQRIPVAIQVRNIGAQPWLSDGPNPVRLGMVNDKASAFAADDSTWISPTRIAMQEKIVTPGSLATFKFTYQVPLIGGQYQDHIDLVAEGQKWMYDQSWMIGSTVKALEAQVVTQLPAVLSPIPLGENMSVKLSFKNTGDQTWNAQGLGAIRLAGSAPFNRISAFCGAGWVSDSRISMQQDSVFPGQVATFLLPLNASTIGDHSESFRLVSEGTTWFLADPDTTLTFQVVPRVFSAMKISETGFDALTVPGGNLNVSITLLNTGNTTWYSDANSQSAGHPVRLGIYSPLDGTSKLASTGWIGNNRIAMQTASVPPGQTGVFTFSLQLPYSGEAQSLPLALVQEASSWSKPVEIWKAAMPSPLLSYQVTDYSGLPATVQPGSSTVVSVTIKNTGNAIWHAEGAFPLRLGTNDPLDRQSIFSSLIIPWIGNERVAYSGPDVLPGNSAAFTFTMVAPGALGQFVNHFQPLLEGVTRLNGPDIVWGSIITK